MRPTAPASRGSGGLQRRAPAPLPALRSWLEAQAQAAQLLSLASNVPLLAGATRLLTAPPRVDTSANLAGVPTTEARPGRGHRWPTLVFLNGVTSRGRFHPEVERLTQALARIGFLVLVPDPPGLATGEITERTLLAAFDVAEAAADRPDARDNRVGLVGVSVGVSLGLLAAEQSGLAERITVVAGIAPYLDFTNVVRLATTGHLLVEGRLEQRVRQPFMSLVAARSLLASLPPNTEREALRSELRRFRDDEPDPLALFRDPALADLDPDTRTVVELLANDDPDRFDALQAALPAELRANLERLSPMAGAERLRVPVEFAVAPDDKYLPLSEAHAFALAAVSAPVRLTVTSTLEHAVPKLSLTDLLGLARFDGWTVRVLRAARASAGSRP